MKRILSIILCITVLFTLCFTVNASSSSTLKGNSECVVGENISLTLSISNCPDVTSIGVSINTGDVFEFVSYEWLQDAILKGFYEDQLDGALAFEKSTNINGELITVTLKALSLGTEEKVSVKIIGKNAGDTVYQETVTKSIDVVCGKHDFGPAETLDDDNHKQVCKLCNAEIISAHNWDKGTVTRTATCISAGNKRFTCSTCGQVKNEEIPKISFHTFNNWKVEKEATCTESGTEIRICSYCQAKETRVIEATGHKYDNDCDTTCNVCGKTREITHSYGEAWSNDETNHWHECSVCHTRKDEAAHTLGAEATETTAQVCTVCGYVIKAPLGHTHRPTIVKRVEPTCEKAGNIEHYKCSCGKLYYDAAATKEITNAAKIILSATGHTRGGDWKSSEIYHWHECAVCGERMDTAFHRAGAEATETTPQTCAVCGYVIKEALGHTHSFTEKNTDAKYLKSAATCSASAEYYYSCSCGEKGTETFKSGEKLAHNFKTEWSSNGEKHWHECSLCGEKKEESSHSFEWKIDKAATATEAGSKHEECTVCGFKKDAVTIEPTGTTTTTPAQTTTGGTTETPEKSGNAWILIAVAGVVVLGGGAAAAVVAVKKKKEN